MTHQLYTLRPAMTAIAAVIALSSTSSFAQSVETPAPIVESTPILTPATPDPLAADPIVTDTSNAAEPVASETVAPPAATARRAATASRPAVRNRTTTRSTTVKRTVAAAPAVAATAAPVIAAPVEPVPAMPEIAAPAPVVPIVEPTPVASETVLMDEALPIAGAAGLGLLALAGVGMAMRRRRRRAEDAIIEAKREEIDAAPEAEIEPEFAPEAAIEPEPAPTFVRTPPTFVATPMADPVPLAAAATATELPDGFDISKFGPHVQAAYRGPTADNPSLSLKRRLTTGHFLDKKALEANPAPAAAPSEPVATPAPNSTWKTRGTAEDFMFRRSDSKPKLRPVHQK